MITENLSTLKIHKLTQEQYNRELDDGNIDPNALYLTPDEEILSSVTYVATLLYANWTLDDTGSYYFQDVTVAGICESDNPIVDINPRVGDTMSDILRHSNNMCKVFHITTSDNSIRAWSTEAIDHNIPIQLKVVR